MRGSAILGKIIHAAYFIEISIISSNYIENKELEICDVQWFNSNSLDAVIRQNCLGVNDSERRTSK